MDNLVDVGHLASLDLCDFGGDYGREGFSDPGGHGDGDCHAALHLPGVIDLERDIRDIASVKKRDTVTFPAYLDHVESVPDGL